MRRFRSNTTQLNTNLTKKMKRGIIEFIQNWKIRVRNFRILKLETRTVGPNEKINKEINSNSAKN